MSIGLGEFCRICCRPLAAPARQFDARGKVVLGCVAADHDGHLVPLSESLRWHNRPEAKKLRKAQRDALEDN